MYKIAGFGGGCHWCTEAVFASLTGVQDVQQGWISSQSPNSAFSEAVLVSYEPAVISLRDLIEVHLYTHASTSQHALRAKYRSAVYCFDKTDEAEAQKAIATLQMNFQQPIVTQVLPFVDFKESLPEHRHYYYSNPEKPFCTLYIEPKLQLLQKKFSRLTNETQNQPD